MAKKRNSNLPKNDFAAEEDIDVCGFTSEPIITGDCISSFSFEEDSSENTNGSSTITNTKIDIPTPEVKNNFNNTTNNINLNTNSSSDNRKTSIVNGAAPPIDGECLDVKRTYMLRASTVRKINELKSIHPELNTYVSIIVDMAIAHYYEHIVNEGGVQ